MKNNALKKVLMNMFGDGLYEKVDNLEEYSLNVELRVFEYFETDVNKTISEKILEIEGLIDEYGCLYLNGLLEKYKQIEKQREEG